MRTNKKICFISSTGGHFEQIKQLNHVAEKYDHYYVLPKNKSTMVFPERKYLIGDFYRKKERILFYLRFMWTALQQLYIFIKERPDVVITTGAGVAFPTCIYAHIFQRKIIYIESFARMKSLNVTGQKIYPYADLFVVQWSELLKIAPKAVYGGWIY